MSQAGTEMNFGLDGVHSSNKSQDDEVLAMRDAADGIGALMNSS